MPQQSSRRPRLAPEGAVGQVIGFMVAGVVFVAAVGAILLTSTQTDEDDHEAADAAAQAVEAYSLLDLLTTSPGIGTTGDPDAIQRLGLLAANGTGLNMQVLQRMRGATYDATSNDLIDYEEARVGLGIPEGTDFHIRMYPVGLDSSYLTGLAGTRVAFIGHWLTVPATILVSNSDSDAAQLASVQTQLNHSLYIGPRTQAERAALVNLGVDYTDRVHLIPNYPSVGISIPLLPDPQLLDDLGLSMYPGDVYPDSKQYLDHVLKDRICGTGPTCVPQYDVLVVGSEVDQSSMTSDATKTAIKNWVLAGGSLVVFGSGSQNFQWLQPLFAVGQSTVNGGPFAPDIAHPLLHEPNTLDWSAYDNHGLGWDIKSTGSGAHYNDFTHVIVEGGEDVLAVSNTGAFGSGRIFLSTYRAGEIAGIQGSDEAMGLLANIFLYTQRTGLYLEYGPLVEEGHEVTAAIAQSLVFDEKLGAVAVRLEIHLWESS